MAKNVTKKIKLQIEAGKATPAGKLGPALGQAGINIGDFVTKFNAATAKMAGNKVSVLITVFEDRSYDFIVKTPPSSVLIKKAANLAKGSGTAGKEKISSITRKQVEEIAKTKMEDLSTADMKQAIKSIEGTARSMGVEVVN